MSTYLTDGTTSVDVDAVEGFSSTRNSGVHVHPILGAASPDITYQAAGLRTGTLRLLFLTEAAAAAAETLHSTGSIITIVSAVSTVNFSYVSAEGDSVRLEQSSTRAAWFVEIDYQEVSA